MTKKKPKLRPASINAHFRREWLFIGAVWLALIVIGGLFVGT